MSTVFIVHCGCCSAVIRQQTCAEFESKHAPRGWLRRPQAAAKTACSTHPVVLPVDDQRVANIVGVHSKQPDHAPAGGQGRAW